MDWKLALLLAVLFLTVAESRRFGRQAPTEAPDADETEIDDCITEDEDEEEDQLAAENVPQRALLAAEYFPDTISRERALRMLKRAVEMIEKPSSSRKQCRRDPDIDTDAKNALRFLTGDPGIGSTTDESSSSSTSHSQEMYCPQEFAINNTRKVSDSTIKNILHLHNSGKSEKAIQSQYRWFHRQYLPRMRQYIEAGGSHNALYEDVDRYVQSKINASLEAKLPIHDYHLRQWGYERADELNLTSFKASQSWLTNVKKRGNLVGRKVTKLISRSDRANEAEIEESRIAFPENYRQVGHLYPHHRILNVDQSGHKYEISNLRSLARRGSRDHSLAIDSLNKNTHSYTIQPILGRDGRFRGKLLICFREPADHFGVQVTQRIRQLESELGNVVAVASRSGKMSTELTNQWVKDVLEPVIANLEEEDGDSVGSQDSQSTELAGPSWASNPPESWTPEQRRIMDLRNSTSRRGRQGVMLLLDVWGGHSSDELIESLIERNIFVLRIPARTTRDLQPLDVQVFRQYKIFVKRVMEAASYEGILQELTDRYGIMRLQSVIYNQFQAPVYRDMLLWAWRKTDPDFNADELQNSPPPDMVLKNQFEFDRHHNCEVEGCSSRAFIRCAHCRKHLCLKHFLARKCFHHDDQDFGNATSSTARPTRRRDRDDDGSSGAAGAAGATGAIVTGAGIAGGTAFVGSNAALGASITATGSAALPSRGGGTRGEETLPMIPISKPYLENVVVQPPATSFEAFIRDEAKESNITSKSNILSSMR